MGETTSLPGDIRGCPECGGNMHAQRATRGGGWGGQGLRHLYRCADCGHEALLESRVTRNQTGGAGWLLILIGIGLAFLMAPPGGYVLGALAILLGLFGIRGGSAADRRYPLREGRSDPPRSVPLEEIIHASAEDARRSARRNRILMYAIYVILAINALVMLYQLLMQ